VRLRRQGLLAVAGVCLLAGCGGDGGSGAEPLPPVPSVSTTVSVTPSASAPVVEVSPFPATAQGARDFTAHVYRQIDTAYASKDPELVRPLFATDCQSCGNFLATLENLRDGTTTWAGGPSTVLDVATPGAGIGPAVEVITRVDYPGARFTSNDGTTSSEPASILNTRWVISPTSTSYLVKEITLMNAEPAS
jgi:hypothetical protein